MRSAFEAHTNVLAVDVVQLGLFHGHPAIYHNVLLHLESAIKILLILLLFPCNPVRCRYYSPEDKEKNPEKYRSKSVPKRSRLRQTALPDMVRIDS